MFRSAFIDIHLFAVIKNAWPPLLRDNVLEEALLPLLLDESLPLLLENDELLELRLSSSVVTPSSLSNALCTSVKSRNGDGLTGVAWFVTARCGVGILLGKFLTSGMFSLVTNLSILCWPVIAPSL